MKNLFSMYYKLIQYHKDDLPAELKKSLGSEAYQKLVEKIKRQLS